MRPPVYTYNFPTKPVFITSLAYLTGKHELKVGYQYNGNDYRTYTESTSHYPAGLLARYRNGQPDSVQTFNSRVDTQNYTSEHAVYVQDRWRPTRKMTVNSACGSSEWLSGSRLCARWRRSSSADSALRPAARRRGWIWRRGSG